MGDFLFPLGVEFIWWTANPAQGPRGGAQRGESWGQVPRDSDDESGWRYLLGEVLFCSEQWTHRPPCCGEKREPNENGGGSTEGGGARSGDKGVSTWADTAGTCQAVPLPPTTPHTGGWGTPNTSVNGLRGCPRAPGAAEGGQEGTSCTQVQQEARAGLLAPLCQVGPTFWVLLCRVPCALQPASPCPLTARVQFLPFCFDL